MQVDKNACFEALLHQLQTELTTTLSASKDAAEYATNQESKADSKYDTQGLEASYLAAGQALHAKQQGEAIRTLRALKPYLTADRTRIELGAVFACNFGESEEWFYFAPVAGGEIVVVDKMEITILTAQSPLANQLKGRGVGYSFASKLGSKTTVAFVA